MSRLFAIAVAATLALPLVALAALIGEQEARLARSAVLNVPLRGYDPRDILRGHYMLGRLDWEWDREPAPANDAPTLRRSHTRSQNRPGPWRLRS